MPIYEYVCKQCHQEFETLVRGSEQPQCPHCGAQQLDRLLSVPAAHVAGSTAPPCGMGACPARDGGGCCGLDGPGGCGL